MLISYISRGIWLYLMHTPCSVGHIATLIYIYVCSMVLTLPMAFILQLALEGADSLSRGAYVTQSRRPIFILKVLIPSSRSFLRSRGPDSLLERPYLQGVVSLPPTCRTSKPLVFSEAPLSLFKSSLWSEVLHPSSKSPVRFWSLLEVSVCPPLEVLFLSSRQMSTRLPLLKYFRAPLEFVIPGRT